MVWGRGRFTSQGNAYTHLEKKKAKYCLSVRAQEHKVKKKQPVSNKCDSQNKLYPKST